MTKYYDEFLRYYDMAQTQQRECNLGHVPHLEGTVRDDLMRHVELYDVVERKYAGFTQILLDMWYGDTPEHPYQGKFHPLRAQIAKAFTGKHKQWDMADWLYVFITHRVTGSGINYAKKPSGYNNTIMPDFAPADSVGQMIEVVRERAVTKRPFYTSVGYQFCAFPKPSEKYKRGGDYFLCEFAPVLAVELGNYLQTGPKKTLREVGEFMLSWNRSKGLRAYKFQYAAVVADIADFFPETVDTYSPFFYGTNAEECISYLAVPTGRNRIAFLDAVMDRIALDTGARHYDGEDVTCDMIRWLENYIRPGADYQHVDRDKVWNSSTIADHPFGRQKAMLDLGLIRSFNDLTVHPSDDYVIRAHGLTADTYRMRLVADDDLLS